MAKAGEIDYLKHLNDHAIWHAIHKPFSDPLGHYLLAEMAALIAMLPPRPARVLDAGCGTGWSSLFLARSGFDVLGADISPDMIAHAGRRAAEEGLGNLRFLVADYEELDLDEEFDAVIYFDSLHHAVDEMAALTCAHRALRRGGICLTSEPGRGHDQSPQSIEAVRRYNVTEKAMPPEKVVRLGRQIGFRAYNVFPHAAVLHGQVYHQSRIHPTSQGGLLRRFLRGAARWAKAPLRPFVHALRFARLTHGQCWHDGITMLIK
jgi:SAM-dependent methyltransferase